MHAVERLLTELNDAGIASIPQNAVLEEFTDAPFRINCGWIRPDGRVGAGYWMEVREEFGFVGLWSGWLYLVNDPSACVELARTVHSQASGVVNRLPESVLSEFRLQSCEEVYLSTVRVHCLSDIDADNRSTSAADNAMQRLRAAAEGWRLLGADCYELGGANRRAIIRVNDAAREAGIWPLMLLGRFPGPEVSQWLRRVVTAAGLHVYDPNWSCARIDFDDPYYQVVEADSYPSRPGSNPSADSE